LGVSGILTIRKIYDTVKRKYYNYPDGPCGLPIIGSLLKIFNYEYISSLTNCYGSVFMVYVGQTPMIFINDLELATKYLNKKEFSNKDIRMTQGYNDFLEMQYSKNYVFRRQLLHKSFITVLNADYLNQIGIKILQKDLFKKFNEKAGSNEQYTEKTLQQDLGFSIFALFFTTTFGKYRHPKKEDYEQFMPALSAFFSSFMENILAKTLLGSNQVTQYILSKTLAVKQDYYNQKLLDLAAKWLHDFEKNYVNNGKSIRLTENEPPVVQWYKQYKIGKLTRKEMIADIRVIMLAGVHSTSAMTTEMVNWLCVLPEIEKKIYIELKGFEDKYGIFQLKHVEELHLLRAFVHEVFRFPAKGSFGNLPRAIIDDDIEVNGYNVPKNSQIVVGYDKFGHEENLWKNPYKFDLDNFMEDGKFKNNAAFVKFGIGRRNCPGMSLAKKEIYLLLGRMILNYRFYTKDNDLIQKSKNMPDWTDINHSSEREKLFDGLKINVEKRN